MNALRGLIERLRPLVGEKCWDYCVFWGLSEDQRCFEFLGCCCGGADGEQRLREQLFPVCPVLPCRDTMFQHQKTKACETLEKLPSSMPTDSGNHTQALISNQPRWLIIPTMSDSDDSDESATTMVLIPVAGGLVELFVSKHVPEDGQIVEFVMAQCNSIPPWEHQEAMEVHIGTDSNFHGQQPNGPSMNEELFLSNGYSMKPGNHFQHWLPPPGMDNQPLPWDPHLDNQPSLSSQIDFMGNQRPDDQPLINAHVGHGFQSLAESAILSDEIGYEKESIQQGAGGANSASGCSDQIDDEEESVKASGRSGRGPKSKNLLAERKRRKKLNDRLYDLRSLVPRISKVIKLIIASSSLYRPREFNCPSLACILYWIKMDRASILKDAIDFIKELQQTAKDLQDELEDEPEEDETNNIGCDNNGNEKSTTNVDHGTKCTFADKESDAAKKSNDSCTDDKEHQMEPQVEVSPVGGKEFFLKVLCEHKPRGFVRLMEAMNTLGLEVTNTNVTTFKGLVSNVFRVEKRESEAVQADQVRESLLEVTRSPTGTWQENEQAAENGTEGRHNIHQQENYSSHHHIHHLGHQPIELNP